MNYNKLDACLNVDLPEENKDQYFTVFITLQDGSVHIGHNLSAKAIADLSEQDWVKFIRHPKYKYEKLE